MEPAKKLVTWDEMLLLELETGLKHEFQDGVAVAMAGGSINHAWLQGNARDVLKNLADPRGCQVYPSDLRLWIPAVGRSTYADASLFCEPEADEARQALLNPRILVEVLSPSTADYDLGGKFLAYRTIPSLQHVLFIDSERIWVTHARRNDEDWTLRDHGAGATIQLDGYGTIEVDALYDRWEPPEAG